VAAFGPTQGGRGNLAAVATLAEMVISKVCDQVDRRHVRALFPQPDPGDRVYYLGQSALWSVGAAGGVPERIADKIVDAQFSADRRLLMYCRNQNGKPAFWIESPPGAKSVEWAGAPAERTHRRRDRDRQPADAGLGDARPHARRDLSGMPRLRALR
jgi:hypothetical protein